MKRFFLKDKFEFSDSIIIPRISDNVINSIVTELTFDNPQYKKVKQFSKYSYTNVPPYLGYYEYVGEKGIKVPIGVNIRDFVKAPFKYEDNRVFPHAKYPDFLFTLREDQQKAADAFIASNHDPLVLNGCVEMPTGKGKSVLGIYLAWEYSTPTLVVVHKTDLVEGWVKDINLAFGGLLKPGIIQGKRREVGSTITIATVQTLNNLPEEDKEELFNSFGLVIQDEMHHCPASTFEIVNHFKSRYRLGLTATPERADGLAQLMTLYFGGFCYRAEVKEDDEDILPVEVKVSSFPSKFDPMCVLSKGKWVIADNPNDPKGKRFFDIPYESRPDIKFPALDDFCVKSSSSLVSSDVIREYKKGHSCLVFLTQKEHVRYFRQILIAKGVPEKDIGLYYGDNTPKQNDAVKEYAESHRKFITISTYSKATEGTNVKQWEVVFLVSSLNNAKNVEQAIGRVRRRKSSGKLSTAIAYDYRFPSVMSIRNHGHTRDMRYKKLGFYTPHLYANKDSSKPFFSRGFN